jgi:hypothetical protein
MPKPRLLSFTLFVVACSSSSSTVPPSPSQQCDAIVSDLCFRVVACFPDAGTQADCKTSLEGELNCSSATAVSSGYSACSSAVGSDTCAMLGTADTIMSPTACNGVFTE